MYKLNYMLDLSTKLQLLNPPTSDSELLFSDGLLNAAVIPIMPPTNS